MVNKNTGSTVSTRDLKPNTGKIITQDHIIKFEVSGTTLLIAPTPYLILSLVCRMSQSSLRTETC